MSLDRQILAARGPKAAVEATRPYAYLVENERSAAGIVEPVATLFLTNRECPFRCLMCDLWRNTLDVSVPVGAIPEQIDFALERLPAARHLKLYNSGNFFDPRAIPEEDDPQIAARARPFKTVIVECHPRMLGDRTLRFRDLLGPEVELEVAIGLETIHTDVWPRLNKRMSPDDFAEATRWLRSEGIFARAFVLLRPPWLDEPTAVDWAARSVRFAESSGARCVAVIPTRGGNGVMDELAKGGQFAPPSLAALEATHRELLGEPRTARIFVDLWDAERLRACSRCSSARIAALARMNDEQRVVSAIECDHELDEP